MEAVEVRFDVSSRDVDLVSVSMWHEDERLAREIPRRLVKNCIERAQRRIIIALQEAKGSVERELARCTSHLKELNSKRIDFEAKHGGVIPESPEALQGEIDRLISDLEALRLRRLEAELRDYKRRLDMAMTVRRMKDKHPTVIGLRKKIADLEDRIRSTPAEIQRLESRLADRQALKANFAAVRQAYLEITRKIAEQNAEFLGLQKRLNAIEMELGREAKRRGTTLIAIEQKLRPGSPRLWRVLGCGFGLPLVVGGVLALLPLRVRRRSRIAMTVAIPLLLLAALFTTFSNVLRLRHPDSYKTWKADPVRWIRENVTGRR